MKVFTDPRIIDLIIMAAKMTLHGQQDSVVHRDCCFDSGTSIRLLYLSGNGKIKGNEVTKVELLQFW